MKKIKSIFLCLLFGAFSGIVVWLFIRIMSLGMFFLWEWLPNKVNIYLLRFLICVIGAAIIGVFRKKFGDYPEEMILVMGKIKTDKFYDYKKLPIIFVGALLPIIIGSSVGPEAGLVGLIVALCYLTRDISKIKEQQFSKSVTIIIYVLSAILAVGVLLVLNKLSGKSMSHFPSVTAGVFELKDALMVIPYIIVGLILGLYYEYSEKGLHFVAGKIPPILKETIAGICLAGLGCLIPMLMFSGEEELGELFKNYGNYLPLFLIALSFLKLTLTNICIQFGLKGGHLFPMIMAASCLGYGVAMLAFPESAGHVELAAAIVSAASLGVGVKKPILITLVLMLVFPLVYTPGIFVVAFIGAKFCNKIFGEEK